MTLTALDLFSGGGGISLGLRAAGFDVHGVELHPYLASLQRLNGLSCESADVSTVGRMIAAALAKTLALALGPPTG